MARGVVWTLPLMLAGLLGGAGVAESQQIGPETLAGMEARSIGPAGMSGRIAAIVGVEGDPDILYVGAATGGLWKTVNGGDTWSPIFDDQPILGIGAVAVNPSNPDLVWVGTGEGNPRNSAGVGAGVYKSVDGGRSWAFMGLDESERIHRILLDPADPDVAWVGAMGPAWSDGEQRGVFKTVDGGASWRRVLYVDERTGVSDLIMDPENPVHLLAGLWSFRRSPWFFESGGEGGGLYESYDGGESWTRLASESGIPDEGTGRIGLAASRSSPDILYALVEADPSRLYRSRDAGRRWEVVKTGGGVNPRPFYYTDIAVDPENELRVYNLHSRLQMSEDGGRSFRTIGGGLHPDMQALWIDPQDGRSLWVGTDGGVFVSRDRGASWRFIDTLPVGQFYHVSVDMDVPFNVYGGMQDNGSWRGPSTVWEVGGIPNSRWEEVGFGDGFNTVLDPAEPRVGYSMSQSGGLRRFDVITGERKDIRPWAPDSVALRFNWNSAFAVDPHRPGTIYYGSQFVHRSEDRGETWQIISGDLTTNDPEKQRQDVSGGLTPDATGAENHTTILTIAPSPHDPEVIWAGTDDGNLQLTRTGGGEWTNLRDRIRGVPDGTWIPHIEVSTFDTAVAYVMFDDHRRGNWEPYVFRTENNGRNWDRIVDEDDVRGFVHTLEEDPESPDVLYLGTEFGLYVSLDRGNRWFQWTHGLPSAPVRSLVVHPRDHDLVIGTHGRAIYVLDDVRPFRALATDPGLSSRSIHVFEAPPAYLTSRAAADGYHFPGDALFQGTPRSTGALVTYWVGPPPAPGEDGDLPPDSPPRVEIVDADGTIVRTLDGDSTAGLQRIAWDLREEGGRPGRPGLEVMPGTYTVRAVRGDSTSTTPLEVLPDPRTEIPLQDRIAKRRALEEALTYDDSLREVADRIAEIEGVLADLRRTMGASPEADPGVEASLDSVASGLPPLEARHGRARRSARTVMGMSSSRDAPTEAQRINLSRFGAEVEELVGEVNAFLADDVAPLLSAAERAGYGVIPRPDPIGPPGG